MKSSPFDINVYQLPIDANVHHELNLTVESSILIVLNKEEYHPENEILLSNILKAMNTSLDKVSILQRNPAYPVKLEDENWKLGEIETVISFGITSQHIGMSAGLPPYENLLIGGQNTIFSHSLSQLNTSKDLKIKLWNVLKSIV